MHRINIVQNRHFFSCFSCNHMFILRMHIVYKGSRQICQQPDLYLAFQVLFPPLPVPLPSFSFFKRGRGSSHGAPGRTFCKLQTWMFEPQPWCWFMLAYVSLYYSLTSFYPCSFQLQEWNILCFFPFYHTIYYTFCFPCTAYSTVGSTHHFVPFLLH